MNRPTQKTIKMVFKKNGVQLGNGSLNMIEEELCRYAMKMANRCKEGNLKRLTPDLFWVALGRVNGSSN